MHSIKTSSNSDHKNKPKEFRNQGFRYEWLIISQRGNALFPSWEQFIPTLGIYFMAGMSSLRSGAFVISAPQMKELLSFVQDLT